MRFRCRGSVRPNSPSVASEAVRRRIRRRQRVFRCDERADVSRTVHWSKTETRYHVFSALSDSHDQRFRCVRHAMRCGRRSERNDVRATEGSIRLLRDRERSDVISGRRMDGYVVLRKDVAYCGHHASLCVQLRR